MKNIIYRLYEKWLKMIKASVEETTYNGYNGVVNGRLADYFSEKI